MGSSTERESSLSFRDIPLPRRLEVCRLGGLNARRRYLKKNKNKRRSRVASMWVGHEQERNATILSELRDKRNTLAILGQRYGLSRERVRQIGEQMGFKR